LRWPTPFKSGGYWPSDDQATIHAIRAALGDEMELMAAFNQNIRRVHLKREATAALHFQAHWGHNGTHSLTS
jgi:hypothetical protein